MRIPHVKLSWRVAVSITLLAVCATGLWVLRAGWLHVPDRFNPWAPLSVESEPNFLTRYKLARLSGDREQCARILSTAQITYETLTDRETGPACGLFNAVRIDATTAEVGTPFALTCRTAVSLALWERHVLQPAAESYFGVPVTRIEHFGSYSCRNIYNRPAATRSRHATAEAFDVAGFVLADGRRIRVLRDWPQTSTESRFLPHIRDGACGFFDAVLSPDYNAAHRDHLHLDRGPYRVCR